MTPVRMLLEMPFVAGFCIWEQRVSQEHTFLSCKSLPAFLGIPCCSCEHMQSISLSAPQFCCQYVSIQAFPTPVQGLTLPVSQMPL